MTQVPDDELISAYLDGELSGEELLRAEQLLATQPESRQLLEELTALRASLQSLPKNTLGAGFADRVLRRAEREMLQPSAPATVQWSGTTPDDDRPPLLSWRRWQRPLAWSALAIAAGLLIMAFSPEEQKVAIAPAPPGGELTAAAPRPAENAPAVALATRDAEGNPADVAAKPMAAQQAPAANYHVADDATEKDRTPQAAEDLFDTGADRVLVVQCDVTARADAETALRELLATQQIAWQSQKPQASPGGSDKPYMALKKAGANKPGATVPPEVVADSAAPDAIYIVAEKEQLQTALDSLQAAGTFRNVTLNQRTVPADALATYDELSSADASTATAGDDPARQKDKAIKSIPLNAQNQLGRALQLPLAEAQSNLHLPDVTAAAGVADAKQESTSPKPAPQNYKLRASRQKGQQTMPAQGAVRHAAQVARPAAPDANVPSAPRGQQAPLANTSRALIILRVAPENAAPAEPPAKQE